MKSMMVLMVAAMALQMACEAGDLALIREAARIKPAYTVVKNEKLNYGTVKRLRVRAIVPEGLSTNEVAANLKHTILQHTLDQHAICVAFYEKGDNVSAMYTVAMGEWAPYGDWGKAAEGIGDTNLDTYKFTYKLSPGYFKAPVNGVYYSGLTKTQRNQLVAEMEQAALKIGQEGAAEMNKAGDFSAAACRKQIAVEDERNKKAYALIASKYGITGEQAEQLWSDKLTEQFGN